MSRWWICGRAVVLLLLASSQPASAHPLHTTLTELTENRAKGTVRAEIRVFADDFATAVTRSLKGRTSAGAAWNSAALAYITRVFTLTDKSGKRVVLHSCGIRRTADLLWVCLEGEGKAGLGGSMVQSSVLCELFEDQINIVQSFLSGTRKSVLFTRGDKAKSVA